MKMEVEFMRKKGRKERKKEKRKEDNMKKKKQEGRVGNEDGG